MLVCSFWLFSIVHDIAHWNCHGTHMRHDTMRALTLLSSQLDFGLFILAVFNCARHWTLKLSWHSQEAWHDESIYSALITARYWFFISVVFNGARHCVLKLSWHSHEAWHDESVDTALIAARYWFVYFSCFHWRTTLCVEIVMALTWGMTRWERWHCSHRS